MSPYKTKPVSEISPNPYKDAVKALQDLPLGQAMLIEFVPKGESATRAYGAWFSKIFPERKIHQNKDSEGLGIWFWWKPKDA